MGYSRSGLWVWPSLVVCIMLLLKAEAGSVPITYLESAVAKGAVCLDGSAPAYHFDKGFGSGISNWIVHMEGGGWCESVESCVARSSTELGSSKQMVKAFGFSGILSSMQKSNPDFYNWNRIKVRYCDGSSFTGDSQDPANNLFFRGERIWQAIIDDLMAKGMANANNAVLSGCSAGALGSILHCDKFHSLFPAITKVKCISDAGFFLHAKDISGGSQIEKFYGQVVKLHGSEKNLPASCTAAMGARPELCFFPQYVVQTMKTPMFFLNSGYDFWQIKNILAPSVADKGKNWKTCKLDLTKCSPDQLQTIQDYRGQLLRALPSNSSVHGLFIDSCYAHCQIGKQITWDSDTSTVVDNTKIAKAVGDWYYNRSDVKKIDCPYPCNPTCVEVDSD